MSERTAHYRGSTAIGASHYALDDMGNVYEVFREHSRPASCRRERCGVVAVNGGRPLEVDLGEDERFCYQFALVARCDQDTARACFERTRRVLGYDGVLEPTLPPYTEEELKRFLKGQATRSPE